MAEIEPERARRPIGRSPLALGPIVAAPLASMPADRGEEGAAPPPGGPATASVVATARDAVGESVRCTAAHRTRTDADHAHEYTARSIRHLAATIAALEPIAQRAAPARTTTSPTPR